MALLLAVLLWLVSFSGCLSSRDVEEKAAEEKSGLSGLHASGGWKLRIEALPAPFAALEIPIEMEVSSLAESVASEVEHPALRISRGGAERFLLQPAPAVFTSPGDRIKKTFCALLPGETSAGDWSLDGPSDVEHPFDFSQSAPGVLTLLEDGGPVLSYNFGMQARPGVPEDRWRSTYIHPLYDLSGRPLTDDFPEDHLHHRGLSWMWQRVLLPPKGNSRDQDPTEHDLWHIRGIRQRFETWLGREAGPVCASFGVRNSWQLEDRKVADEWVWVRVFRAGPTGRAIDLSLTWKPLETILLKGEDVKGYGGLCLRLGPREENVIVASEGVQTDDSDLRPFPWADYSGRFGGGSERSGVAIFQHPDNPGFPAGWCLRHYGFLGVSFPGDQPLRLEAGDVLRLRFRLWVHSRDAVEGKVADAYRVFARPPVLKWTR